MVFNVFRSLAIAVISIGFSHSIPAIAAPFDQIETRSTVPLSGFKKIYIAPVDVELDELRFRTGVYDRDDTEPRPVSDDDKRRKAEYLEKHLNIAFKKKFEIVDAPGEDVLTISATLTRLVATRPTEQDFGRTATPVTGAGIYPGGADFYVELSQGDAQLGSLSKTYQASLSDSIPRTTQWQDADNFIRRFSKRLAWYVRKN